MKLEIRFQFHANSTLSSADTDQNDTRPTTFNVGPNIKFHRFSYFRRRKIHATIQNIHTMP